MLCLSNLTSFGKLKNFDIYAYTVLSDLLITWFVGISQACSLTISTRENAGLENTGP